MVISYIQGTVRGPAGAEATVRFLIDSGAMYSLLLGVVTLEILGLVFDPFRRTLHPMRALMV